jgi:hypothetical protein
MILISFVAPADHLPLLPQFSRSVIEDLGHAPPASKFSTHRPHALSARQRWRRMSDMDPIVAKYSNGSRCVSLRMPTHRGHWTPKKTSMIAKQGRSVPICRTMRRPVAKVLGGVDPRLSHRG